ncbi:MAG: hypothetical protein EZS28_036935, partial [Streblomastix strix]
TGEVQKEDEFRQIMIKNGGMNKLVQYFFDDEIDSSCKDIVAIAICSINAAVQIPDEFRGAVISHLKKIKEDSDILQLIGKSLAGLAENIEKEELPMSDHPFVDDDACVGCQTCANSCPNTDVLWEFNSDGKAVFRIANKDECIHCQTCMNSCPAGAITFKVY